MSSTPEKPMSATKRPVSETGMYKTYNDFVDGFLSGLSSSLAQDGSKENEQSSKRLKSIKASKLSAAKKACAHRFALAADDALYLNAGVSLLCVDGADDRELAPSTLYAADTLEATKEALLALASGARERRARDAPDVLNQILQNLQAFWYGTNGLQSIDSSSAAFKLLVPGAEFKNDADGIKAMSDLVEELEQMVRSAEGSTIVGRFTNYVTPEAIQDLRRQAEQLNVDREELAADRFEIFQGQSNLQDAIAAENRKLAAKKGELNRREAAINDELTKISDAKRAFAEEINTERAEFQAELDAEKAQLQREKREDEKAYNIRQAALDGVDADVKKRRADVESKERELGSISRAQREIYEKDEALKKEKAFLERKQRELNSRAETLATLEETRERLEAQRERTKSERQSLEVERKELEAEERSIETERAQLSNERAALEAERRDVAQERDNLQGVLDSQAKLDEQQRALDEREAVLGEKNATLEALSAKIESLEKDNAEQSTRLTQQASELAKINDAFSKAKDDEDFMRYVEEDVSELLGGNPKLEPLAKFLGGTGAASKIVRTANLMKAHAAQQSDFDSRIGARRARDRTSTGGGISHLNPLFWQQAADAFADCKSMSKAMQTPGLSKQAHRILATTSTVLRLRQIDRALTGVGPGDIARSDSAPDKQSLTCALQEFLDEARLHIDALQDTESLLREKVENSLPSGKAEERRSGVWNEMLKDTALATDRLWVFVRTLSGLIGEEADAILDSADDEAIRASKEADKQRSEIAETVSKFHAKLIETLIGGLVKESKLQFTTPEGSANKLVVVDSETSKQLHELASGQSGKPFFEANVALRNLEESAKGRPRALSELIDGLSDVSKILHQSLVRELNIGNGVAGSSLSNLSKPANSYFVKLRDDTSAAIRLAFDRFSIEYSLKSAGRRISLYELIEGSDNILSTRFAEFSGHLLIQNRLSTGVNAMYTSRAQAGVNATQAHVSLARLINQAAHYASSTPAPTLSSADAAAARKAYFEQASNTTTWASGMGAAFGPTRSLYTSAVISTSGPVFRGLSY